MSEDISVLIRKRDSLRTMILALKSIGEDATDLEKELQRIEDEILEIQQ